VDPCPAVAPSKKAKNYFCCRHPDCHQEVDLLANEDVLAFLHQKMEDVCFARAAEELARTQLSSKKRPKLGLDLLSTASGSSQSDETLMSQLALDGYKVEPAMGQLDHQVIRAQMGEEVFAVKWVYGSDGQEAQDLRNEYDILQKLTHPSVVKVKGVGLVVASDGCAIVTELVLGQKLSLIMPILERMESHGIASQLLSVFAYLHNQHRIAHRDLTGESIMLSRQGNQAQFSVKLIDFGSAREEDQEEQRSKMSCSQSASSCISSIHDGVDPRILPPGPGLGRGDAFEMDVFAIGLILVGLLQKHEMFTSDVFNGLDLRLALTQVTPLTEQYLRDILHPTGRKRSKIEAAFRDLPPIEAWFTDHQGKPSEVAAESASNVQSGRARPAIFMCSCLSCFPARSTKKDRV